MQSLPALLCTCTGAATSRPRGWVAPAVRNHGFTLMEFLVTLCVLLILITVVTPSFIELLNGQRTRTEMADLMFHLQNARSEAIREGMTVSLCGSSNGRSCDVAPDIWEKGWIVFSDPNGNQKADVGEPILWVAPALNGGDTLRGNQGLPGLSFNREGFAMGLTTNLTFTLHTQPIQTSATRCLLANMAGTLQIQSAINQPTTCM
jgi:type IV fimbrial biogenesis protein FimT